MFKYVIIALFIGFADQSFASSVDLWDVYQQALKSDPTYAQDFANALVTMDNVAIEKAGLLPNISLTGSATETHAEQGNPINNGTNDEYSLALTQPIFNYGIWLTYQSSQLSAKSASATLAANLQDLMARTANAYIAEALSQKIAVLNQGYLESLQAEFKQTQLLYRAGLAKGADLSSAQASVANAQVEVISANANEVIAQSQLQAITGVPYNDIALLKTSPNQLKVTDNLQTFLNQAKLQNLNLLAARFAMLAAKSNIAVEHAGHYPQLDADLSYSGNQSNNNGLGNTNSNGGTAGLSLTLPIYQGGLVVAQTTQALHQYQSDLAQYVITYRQTIQQTQQGYTDLLSSLQKMYAGQIAVNANQENYKQMEISYQAGIRTMVDVLLAKQNLYQAKLSLLDAEYGVLTSYIELKQALGTLSVNDLLAINRLLG